MAATPNVCAGPFGALYSFYIERPRLMQLIGRAMWGIDSRPIYAALAVLETVPGDATVADVPCGSGLALRALPPGRRGRYLAVDIDERMLRRTRERAGALGLEQEVETLRADMTALPFEDGSVDLFLSISGLHMVADPGAAVLEAARSLRVGGELHGTTFVREGSSRQRMLFNAGALRGHPRPPTRDALCAMLDSAGFETLRVGSGGGMTAFAARLL